MRDTGAPGAIAVVNGPDTDVVSGQDIDQIDQGDDVDDGAEDDVGHDAPRAAAAEPAPPAPGDTLPISEPTAAPEPTEPMPSDIAPPDAGDRSET
jgi:hypothetical protein